MKSALYRIAHGQTLNTEQAEQAVASILEGRATQAQIGAFLMGLRARTETRDELLGAAHALRQRMKGISAPETALDIIGTGGDKSGSYNISTAVALTVAACGIPVAKHGNRFVSSQSGAADVLQALGVNLDCDFARLEQVLEDTGLCFLMTPRHHPTLKNVTTVRQELGTSTLFDLLAPLINPASVRRHLIGVFDRAWLVPFAEVLRELGSTDAWIVHGEDGMDEITTTGRTYVAELRRGTIRTFEIHPDQAGLFTTRVGELKGGDATTNAAALRAMLAGAQNAYRNIVLFNAAAALVIANKAQDLRGGVDLAREAIDTGRAKTILDKLIAATNR